MDASNREAAEVDLFIRKLQPRVPERVAPIGSGPPAILRHVLVARRPGAVRACVGLGVALGVAMPYWPYFSSCGWPLLPYGLAVFMVFVAGVWGARLTWHARLGFSHTIAIATTLWGIALAAHIVLPRAGYAKSVATWICQ
jgi:hypothetical protein